jgi:hypothetical protein
LPHAYDSFDQRREGVHSQADRAGTDRIGAPDIGYNCIGRLERRHGGMIERMWPYGLFDLPKLGFNVIAIPTFEGK